MPAGLVALVHGWRPGWAKVAWAVLAVWFVLGYLGGLLQRARLAGRSLAVLAHPSCPGGSLSLGAPLVIAAVAVLLVAARASSPSPRVRDLRRPGWPEAPAAAGSTRAHRFRGSLARTSTSVALGIVSKGNELG